MSTFLYLLMIVSAIILIILAAPAFFSRKEDSGVNIHLDENSVVGMERTEEGIRINIKYTESGPSDYELFPNLVEAKQPSGDALDRSFWLKVISLETLPKDEQKEVKKKLIERGFLTESDFLHIDGLVKEEPIFLAQQEEKQKEPDYGGIPPEIDNEDEFIKY